MKKIMLLALAAMLTTASVPAFAQDKAKCNKECCKKCDEKCKEECKSGKCHHEECQKKCEEKKSCCKKQA